jgi:hypothetical protein
MTQNLESLAMQQLKRNFTQLVIVLFFVMFGLIALSVVLANRVHAADSAAADFSVPVSINALMVTLIDHSAHYIWDYGVLERQITADEWRTIEYYAIQLAGSGPLITLGGSGPLDDAWARSPEWIRYSKDMSAGAIQALDASKSRDKSMLLNAGNILIDSCEGCHQAFKPELPTEGFTHQPDYDYLYHLFR